MSDTSTTLSASRYTNQQYPFTPSTPAALLQVAQGTQDARNGLPLPVEHTPAYIDGWAIAASAIRVKEHGARLSQMAATFRRIPAQAAAVVAEVEMSEGEFMHMTVDNLRNGENQFADLQDIEDFEMLDRETERIGEHFSTHPWMY